MAWYAGIAVLAYLILVLALYLAQRAFLYHPNGGTPHPAGAGLSGIEIVRPKSHDGLDLFAWWLPPRDAQAPIFLYFHGNAGSLDDRADKFRRLQERGVGMLMATYRYNAGTGGKPSEEALIADGRALLDWLGDRGFEDRQVVLYGESLGSGIAVALAAEARGAAVIVEGAYDSIADVAQKVYWYVPARRLVKDSFDSVSRIGRSTKPILVAHGTRDDIIGIDHARRLFDAANEPKTFLEMEEGGHVDLYDFGMQEHVDRFLSQYVTR